MTARALLCCGVSLRNLFKILFDIKILLVIKKTIVLLLQIDVIVANCSVVFIFMWRGNWLLMCIPGNIYF